MESEHYFPTPENAIRQSLDATAVFDEYRRVRNQALRTASGTMYWKREAGYEYLVKMIPGRRNQERLGRRSAQTEEVFRSFGARKEQIDARMRSLTQALDEQERLNRAVRAGRVPNLAVSVLCAIEDAGLGDHFAVVGTHALYAYETAASVRLVPGALATQDVDLLWDARKHMQFVMDVERLDSSVLKLLRRVDKTFERKAGHNETAINARGFQVDFLRRMAVDADPHPFRFSADDDLWPVQARRASVLTEAPRFDQVVIGVSGRMALMRTVDPLVFVHFKQWMATQAEDRPAGKRVRDQLQADIVRGLLEQKLLLSAAAAA